MRTLAHCPVSEDEVFEAELKEPRVTAADRAFERRWKAFNGVPKMWARPKKKRKLVHAGS
jgi:hypothetical protein